MKIGRHFEFDASHCLPQREIYGTCSQLHGHRYELVVELCGEVAQEGWIANFSDVKKIINEEIIKKFDHSYINDYIEIPTVENICLYIADHLKSSFENKNLYLSKIKLYETSNCYATIEFNTGKDFM